MVLCVHLWYCSHTHGVTHVEPWSSNPQGKWNANQLLASDFSGSFHSLSWTSLCRIVVVAKKMRKKKKITVRHLRKVSAFGSKQHAIIPMVICWRHIYILVVAWSGAWPLAHKSAGLQSRLCAPLREGSDSHHWSAWLDSLCLPSLSGI